MVFHESLNPERKFSLAIPLVFIAILGGTTGVVGLATVLSPQASFAVNPQAQLALAPATAADAIQKTAAPASKENGQCQAVYDLCTKLSRSDSNRASCESNWHSCVETKCQKIDTKTIDQCPKDSDCITSCTDLVEANGALKKCCSVIKHGNSCRVATEGAPENSCNPDKTKLPGGGTGGDPSYNPSDADKIDQLKRDAETLNGVLQKQQADLKTLNNLCSEGCGEEGSKSIEGLKTQIAQTEKLQSNVIDQIKAYGYGINPDTDAIRDASMPGDYRGESPQKIDEMLKNNATYLGPTSPGLSQSDLLNTPLSELNGRYKYGDLSVSTDGKTYSVWEEGQRMAFIEKVGDGQTIGDVIAQKQYMSGPESPNQSNRDTFAANIEAQGEVSYSSAQASSEQTDTSAFKEWTDGLPEAAMKDPAYDFRSEALDPSVAEAVGNANGDWAKNLKDFNYETAGATPEPGSGELKVGEEVPLPRPVRDLSGSLDVDVSKLPQGVGRIGDGLLVTNDGKEIRITDVASGKTESYYVSETKGAKLADLVQDTQVINGPYAQEADNLRKEANSVAKTEPERAAALRREADQIDPRVPASGPGARAPVDPNGNRVGGAGTPDGSRTNNQNGGGSGFGSALSSMLQGLMKALGAPQPTPAAPSQPCSADPNIYAQQQQQYQQQLQQYNYQIQQQQYQQQMNQYYADRTGAPTPPVQPLPPQPSACTPSTGSQCREQPQQPAAASCTGGWRPVYNGSCVTSWNCPTTGDAPTATLSCEPDLADVGQTLAITYNCSSGVASSSAFKVTTQPGGSATTTVKAPPRGTNTATYTLACTDNGKTTGAQCSVKVNRPNIFLVTNPQTVAPGEISLISWLTTGMDSCIISSPDQADFTLRNSSNTSVTGAATTSPIASSTAMFQLDCITKGGMDKQATTSVSVAP